MQAIEKTIVRKVIRALKANGTPVVSVNDGEEIINVRTEAEILAAVDSVDESSLYTSSAGSWVFLVVGNGEDIVSDYTMDLDDALTPVLLNY